MSELGNNIGAGDGTSPEGLISATGKVGGPPPNIQQLVASKRLQQAQAQVGEVVDIMRVNVDKVLERDQKISELDRRADDLQEGASQFQQQAVKLKRKNWWENIKMWLIIGVVLLVIIVIVVVSTTGQNTLSTATVTDKDSSQDSNPLKDSSPSDSEGSATNGEINSGSSDVDKSAAQKNSPSPVGN